MIEWMTENAWVTWVGVAVLLAVAELLSLDLVLLMFAIGALAGAVASALGAPFWVASEVWSARTEGDAEVAPGAEVVVTRIDGATAVITPKES